VQALLYSSSEVEAFVYSSVKKDPMYNKIQVDFFNPI
jgi:hypothetical protein